MNKCTLPYCPAKICQAINYSYTPSLWEKEGQIISQPKNTFGSVWNDDKVFILYFADFINIYRAENLLGHWYIDDKPVLCGELDKWDKGLDCASVFKDNNKWYLFYRGHGNWQNLPSHAIGLATSNDGAAWEKHKNNPILIPESGQWDGAYYDTGKPVLFDPWGIIKVGDIYYLWYNCDHPNMCRCTGLAYSKDLINWTKDSRNPVFTHGRFCVAPFKYKDWYYMIVPSFGFQRKESKFELYKCKKPTFYPEEREFLGHILTCGNQCDFDEMYIDAPSVLTGDIYRNSFPDDIIRLYYTGEAYPMGQSKWSHGLATISLSEFEKRYA